MIFKKSFIFEDLRDIRTVLQVSNAAHGPLLVFFSLFLLNFFLVSVRCVFTVMMLHENGYFVIVHYLFFSFCYHDTLDEGLCKRGQLSKERRMRNTYRILYT